MAVSTSPAPHKHINPHKHSKFTPCSHTSLAPFTLIFVYCFAWCLENGKTPQPANGGFSHFQLGSGDGISASQFL